MAAAPFDRNNSPTGNGRGDAGHAPSRSMRTLVVSNAYATTRSIAPSDISASLVSCSEHDVNASTFVSPPSSHPHARSVSRAHARAPVGDMSFSVSAITTRGAPSPLSYSVVHASSPSSAPSAASPQSASALSTAPYFFPRVPRTTARAISRPASLSTATTTTRGAARGAPSRASATKARARDFRAYVPRRPASARSSRSSTRVRAKSCPSSPSSSGDVHADIAAPSNRVDARRSSPAALETKTRNFGRIIDARAINLTFYYLVGMMSYNTT